MFSKSIQYFFVLSLAIVMSSCEDNVVTDNADYSNTLNVISNEVILKTYAELSLAAIALHNEASLLASNPSSAQLEKTKTAWRAARMPWEQSEGFLFGPVDQEGLDPALDSWPVNVTDLNNVMAGSGAITATFLAQQEGTLKGFHTIEYLLWGVNSNKTIDQFTARELEYLSACTEVLALDASSLYELWIPTGGNYIKNVIEAGKGSVVYVSQKAALEEIVNALGIIADEVANGKINDPYSSQDLTLEESRFSNNSKADFADNMRSIKNIYHGTYNSGTAAENTLYHIVKKKDAALADQLNQQIDAAILEIENIPGTFTTAVITNRPDVLQAQQAVRALQFTLESKIIPLISNL